MEAVQDAAAAAAARKEGDKDHDADGGGGQGVARKKTKIHCGGGARPATKWKAVEGDKE